MRGDSLWYTALTMTGAGATDLINPKNFQAYPLVRNLYGLYLSFYAYPNLQKGQEYIILSVLFPNKSNDHS